MSVYIIDTETTGTVDPVPVEIALNRIDENLDVRFFFVQKYNPGKPISFGAMATHHILDSDLLREPSISTFSLPSDCKYLIGHNVDFDWEAIGKPDVKRICTLALSRALWPEVDCHSLGALTYFISDASSRPSVREFVRGAHSSGTDAGLTLGLLIKIALTLNLSCPLDFGDLWEESEKSRIPTVMPFGKHKGMALKDVPSDYKRWLLKQPDVDPYLVKALEGA